jgi:hypothetical protein
LEGLGRSRGTHVVAPEDGSVVATADPGADSGPGTDAWSADAVEVVDSFVDGFYACVTPIRVRSLWAP